MPPKSKAPVDISKSINFYTVMDKKYIKNSHNPHYNVHGISIPFRMVICGASGSMKTNTLCNLLYLMSDTFKKIVIITKNKDEPLYNWLSDHMPVEIHEGLHKLPDIDTEFDKKDNSLVIFDDLCLDKNQKCVEEMAIRCRKLGISVIYISQSWFKTPIQLRKNLTHIILKKIAQKTELYTIMNQYTLSVSKEELLKLYDKATKPDISGDTKDKTNYLLIDLEAEPELRFRKCLQPMDISESI